jgi:hypothetical protein
MNCFTRRDCRSVPTRLTALSALALLSAAIPAPAVMAQNAPALTPPPAGPVIPPAPGTAGSAMSGPTGSAVVNLIRLLVEQGILTQDKANALIRQAEDEAAAAARGMPIPPTPAPVSPPTATAAAPAPSTPAAPPAATASTSVRVPYIPEIVRRQIRDEVKEEVLAHAKAENWAAPNALPDWTKRFQLYGDFRLRYEWDIFDNRNSAFFPNFAALNAGPPFDLNNAAGTPPPLLDTTVDRQRMRIRARLGFNAAISDDFTAGIRLATGNTTNPVTTNQTLGTTLNKYNFLLDRAFVLYQPVSWAKVWAGRFENPFMSTDLVWDEDIAMDGVAVQLSRQLFKAFSLFSAGGAFPIENTAFNFPDNSSTKQSNRDKWLYGGQLGLDWQPARTYDVRFGASYYYFDNVEGKLSSPCTVFSNADPCDTDGSRPGFLQQGNTLFAIRDLVSNAPNPPVFQYYGLATPFHELDLTTRFDYGGNSAVHVIVDADYARNLAFNSAKIAAKNPVNNRGASPAGGGVGPFEGGSTAYQARLTLGYPVIHERGDWNVGVAYRYLESDSVMDAFTDSDFHLGGTNAKGYIFGGAFGVAHNVNFTARWLSATEVSGAPYSVDVVLVDFNAQF